MFFIIPIKTEASLKKIPYLTIGLIVFNIIIWIFTYFTLKNQIKELEQLNRSLVEIESQYLFDILATDQQLQNENDIKDMRQRIYDGEIIPANSQDYQNWKVLYEEFLVKRSDIVFEKWGFKPNSFNLFKILASLFVHANIFHLLGNMLFLWLVGCNIEDEWGWRVFLAFYLGAGVVASFFHMAFFPNSDIPCIGASGAIAGIMGAFLIRYYKVKVRFFYFIWLFIRPFFGTIPVYAGLVLPIWFLMELQSATWTSQSGTAHWAHIGGFVFGAIISISLRVFDPENNPRFEEEKKKDPDSVWTDDIARAALHGRFGMDRDYATAPEFIKLKNTIQEEPDNFEARLTLANHYFDKGDDADAVMLYNSVVEIILRLDHLKAMNRVFQELKVKSCLGRLTEKNLYNLAVYFEDKMQYVKAVNLFGLYIRSFKQSRGRPYALHKIYIITRQKLNNQVLAQKVYAVLQKEYPQFLASLKQ